MRPSYGDFILAQERMERRKRRIVIFIIVFVLLLILGVAGLFLFLKKDEFSFPTIQLWTSAEDTEEEVFYSQDELDSLVQSAVQTAKLEASEETKEAMKQQLAEGKSAVEAFRAIYSDELVLAADGRYHFIPIRTDLKMNDYKTENLKVLENGEYQYTNAGEVTSYKGIDVSRFQGNIDWQAVAGDGVTFAFIRVGNRGYGTGEIVDDNMFVKNITGANAAGVKAGVYFFSQAITEEEAVEEANYVLEKIAPYQVECPIVIDLEMIAGDEGRADSLTPQERTQIMKAFCDAIAGAGYKPMIYMNLEIAALRVNMEELEAYDKWFAYYNPELYFPYAYQVWQYSETGTVAGVKEPVDMNICFEPIW